MERTTLSRRVYLWGAWLFLASVVVQVFLIGLYLFAGGDLELHRSVGFTVPFLLSIVIVVAAFAARLPGRSKRWSGAVLVATFVQTSLPGLKSSLPLVAAFHPVVALLMLGIGVVVLRDARDQVRVPAPSLLAAEGGAAGDSTPRSS